MRIVSGKLKGRRFSMPSDKWKTRPTTDQSKESLFNILYNTIDLEDIEVLDLFAGTGNVGYEFISRGATKVTFVEKFQPCIRFMQKMAKEFDISKDCQFIRSDCFKYLKNCSKKFDVIFADPPYNLKNISEIPTLVFEKNLLNEEGLLIVEHDKNTDLSSCKNFVEIRKYGQSIFSFFEYK